MHFDSVLKRAASMGAAFFLLGGFVLAAGNPWGSDIPGAQHLPNGSTLVPQVHHDVSLPLAAIPPVPQGPPEMDNEPARRIPLNLPGNRHDPVIQSSATTLALPTSSSFEGMGAGLAGFSPGGTPPDTNGDVGPNHYVQTVNSSLTVFSKSGAILLGPESINTLWSGFGGGCQTNNDGDPVVKYDRAADRWVVSQFAVSSTPYLQCVAVSSTSDPTGSWYRYSFSFGTSNFNDYPKMGVWPDAYYFSFNIFAGGSTFSGGMACAYDRASMIAGGAAKAAQCFGPKANDGGLLPSDMTGTTAPPGGSPDYYVDLQSTALNLWRFHVDWTTPGNSTFTGPTSLPVASYSALCSGGTCVPQPGTTQQLDSLADRLMYRFAYRNMGTYESLVVNHSVTAGSGGGIRWYEIRSPGGTPTIFQQGTFAPDSSYRWMGSVAMDHVGNIAAGYSISDGSSVKPGIRLAGRLVTDPAGQLSQGESTMVAGGGINTGTYSRWGDYSSMSVDPSDDCTFWYTNEYYASNGDSFHWQTRIGNFKFSSCSTTANPDFSISSSPGSVSVVQGNSGTSTISTTVSNGFNNAISLSASGQPAGVTVSFNPTSIAAPGAGSSTMTMAVGASTATGTYTVTVTGTGGGITHTASVSLTVTAAGANTASYDATLKAPKCAALGSSCDSGASLLLGRASLGPEPNQPNTINSSCADGTSGTFHSDESNDRLKVFTTDGSNFAPGKPVTVQATVWAYSGFTSDHLDLYYAPNASSPVWTLIGTINPTAAGSQVLSGTYTLPSGGSLQAVRANFRYQGSASSCSTGAYDDHDDLIFAVASTPDFAISASPGSVSVVQGSSGGSTVSTTVSGGFNNAVSLSASGQPAGVTVSFNPTSIAAPGSGSSAATFAVASTVATGTYPITITGTGGGTTHTTSVSLTVTPAATPNFTLAASPTSVSVQQGNSGNSTVSTTVSGGFNNAVSLSASGQPSGVTVSFNPASIAAPGSGSSTMTMAVASSTATGTYSITVTGSGGGITHTASVSLTVTSAGTVQQLLANPGFESGNVSWTASAGVIDSSTGEPAHSGSWKAWLDGYGSAHTDTLLQQVSIPSTITTASLSFWLHIDTAETTTTTAFDTLKVQIRNSSGTVLATLATYSNLNKNTGYAQKSFDVSAYKGQTIQVYLVGVEDASLQTSFVVDDFALNVQ